MPLLNGLQICIQVVGMTFIFCHNFDTSISIKFHPVDTLTFVIFLQNSQTRFAKMSGHFHFRQFAFTVLIFFTSNFLVTGQQQDPWETPLDELISICRNSQSNWSTVEWSSCIDSFIQRPPETNTIIVDEFEELRKSYTLFCRDPNAYKHCWKSIIHHLNMCDPQRGYISAKLYFAVFDNTCRNFGKDTIENLRKALEQGDLCELDYYGTKACNETKLEWRSKDICRRYRFQRLCEESVIEKCENEHHKRILLRNLEDTGKSLRCIEFQDSSSTISSSSVSNSQTKNKFAWLSIFFGGLVAFTFFVLKEQTL